MCLRLDDRSGQDVPELGSWYEAMEELHRRGSGGVLVLLDLTGARPDAGRRRQVFEWAAANRHRFASIVRGGAIVAPSPFLRGVLTAARWFLPMALPHEIFDAYEPALAWLRARAADQARAG
jgi:hypothetical protein